MIDLLKTNKTTLTLDKTKLDQCKNQKLSKTNMKKES